MAADLILLDLWHSPFGTRVRIALAEKGVKYEYKEDDLGNKSSLLLKMNPIYKQIPVLIHNGKPVIESMIIVEYIDEVWKSEFPLLPSDPYERSHARFWADYVDKKIYSIGRAVCINENGEVQEAAKKELRECFKVLEGELGNKRYFGGENLGIVDVALIPFSCWFHSYKTCGKLDMETEFPQIVAWVKRCMEKECVSKYMYDQYKFYELLMGLKMKYQAELNSKKKKTMT